MAIENLGLLAGGSGGGVWGSITGTLSSQTDLQSVLNGKQATLVSGTSIKTINSTSVLGSGDIAISGSVSDGDKGDITVSGSGATWTIDSGVVNASKLASDSVETAKILNANVTADKLADNSVTTAKIADSNVTLAKIQNIATASLLGRVTADTGISEVLTASQARALLNVEDGADVTDNANVITALNGIASVAEGDVLYFNGTNWVRLARGTDGQVLTATADSVNWENASSGFADPMTTEGDIIFKTSGGTTTRLARGTDGQVLTATSDSINWENAPSGTTFTNDNSLTEATTSYDIANKNVRITIGSGTTGSLNTIIDMETTYTVGEHFVVIKNNTGVVWTLTTSSLNNFVDGSYPINAGAEVAFVIRRNLLTSAFDETTHIFVANAGEYQ